MRRCGQGIEHVHPLVRTHRAKVCNRTCASRMATACDCRISLCYPFQPAHTGRDIHSHVFFPKRNYINVACGRPMAP